MNYCKCTQPKKVKSDAAGITFEVCSKNLGGCGHEIKATTIMIGANAKYILNGVEYTMPSSDLTMPEVTPKSGFQEQRIRRFSKVRENIGYNLVYVYLCPECNGGGFTMHMYPNGPTEVKCECCNGEGRIEESK